MVVLIVTSILSSLSLPHIPDILPPGAPRQALPPPSSCRGWAPSPGSSCRPPCSKEKNILIDRKNITSACDRARSQRVKSFKKCISDILVSDIVDRNIIIYINCWQKKENLRWKYLYLSVENIKYWTQSFPQYLYKISQYLHTKVYKGF